MRRHLLSLMTLLACDPGGGRDRRGPEDADGDGYLSDADCDDGDPNAFPGGVEVCDFADNDCDGIIDEAGTPDAPGSIDAPTWWADADGDGYGAAAYARMACQKPDGYVGNGDDCDDGDPEANPAATERCDGADDDCDGVIDEDDAADAETWYRDADGDGFGVEEETTVACEVPSGYAGQDGDCDDSIAAVNPAATETWYDGVDQDCDGNGDYDADGDSWDSADWGGEDCDDTDPSVRPGAPERCNSIDDDCDGSVDDDPFAGTTYWSDADGDGYGDRAEPTLACSLPAGYASNDDDCDDADASVNPGVAEVCGDGVDNDCDGSGAGCGISGTIVATSGAGSVTGGADGDLVGAAVEGGADLDGDGFADLVAGAPNDDTAGTNAGGVFVAFGPVTARTFTATAGASLLGGDSGDLAGTSLAAPGDVDGDGYDDLLVGAEGMDGAAAGSGAAWVVHGPISGALQLEEAGLGLLGVAAGDDAGSSAAGGGDVDGDGVVDFVVGAPSHDRLGTDDGAAYLLFGPVTSAVALDAGAVALSGAAAGDQAGTSVAILGDIDGDGFDDVAIGARHNDEVASNAGAVYVLLGPATGAGPLADADFAILGARASDRLGSAVASHCDLDGDGSFDLVAAAPYSDGGASDGGQVWVFAGPDLGGGSLADAASTITGLASQDYLGTSLACGSDSIAGGTSWAFAGAIGYDGGLSDRGAVFGFAGPLSGSLSASDATATVVGRANSDQLGTASSAAGDANADGYVDLVVGAQGAGAGSVRPGEAYLLLGGPGM